MNRNGQTTVQSSVNRAFVFTIKSKNEDEMTDSLENIPHLPATPLSLQIQHLRDQCKLLTDDEKIDKSAALGIATLFHTAETMLLELRNDKDKEIESLNHRVSILNFSSGNSEMLQNITNDISKIGKECKLRDSSINELQTRVQQMTQGPAKKR